MLSLAVGSHGKSQGRVYRKETIWEVFMKGIPEREGACAKAEGGTTARCVSGARSPSVCVYSSHLVVFNSHDNPPRYVLLSPFF